MNQQKIKFDTKSVDGLRGFASLLASHWGFEQRKITAQSC